MRRNALAILLTLGVVLTLSTTAGAQPIEDLCSDYFLRRTPRCVKLYDKKFPVKTVDPTHGRHFQYENGPADLYPPSQKTVRVSVGECEKKSSASAGCSPLSGEKPALVEGLHRERGFRYDRPEFRSQRRVRIFHNQDGVIGAIYDGFPPGYEYIGQEEKNPAIEDLEHEKD